MSARRGLALRVASIGASLVALTAVGCRIGPNPALSPIARSAQGVVVSVDWLGEDPGSWPDTAEVLGFDAGGAYLLQGGSIVLYPFGSPTVLRTPRRGPPSLDLRSANEAETSALAQYARYPFGLDQALLERLLGAIGEDSVLVRSRP